MQRFYANGKLLLTGEYTVLDGALALAIPTRQGQSLSVREDSGSGALTWKSYDHEGRLWLSLRWQVAAPSPLEIYSGDSQIAKRLLDILQAAIQLRGGDYSILAGKTITTQLDFDRHWGLGSSSTLIHCLASWLEVDAFALLGATFGGSAYDLACAGAKGPILFQRQAGQPVWAEVDWRPSWLENTYFLYLNQKQNSREGIAHYRRQAIQASDISAISTYTAQLVETRLLHFVPAHPRSGTGTPTVPAWGWILGREPSSAYRAHTSASKDRHARMGVNLCRSSDSAPKATTNTKQAAALSELASGASSGSAPSLAQAMSILSEHEALTSRLSQQPSIQAALFPDFPGQLKSLGAWGGDFVWVLSEQGEADCRDYFRRRGYEVLLPWSALAL